MVTLTETTKFIDETRKPEIKEKKFKDVHALYHALANSGIKGEVIYDLKKHGKAIVSYEDAQTVIELKIPLGIIK